jgi:hypothetical protein
MQAQWFPIYYPMGAKAFVDADGAPDGSRGAIAELTKVLSNWPVMFLGLRLTNVYTLPTNPTADDLAIFTVCKRFLDDEQTVKVELSQQNITAEPTLQVQLTGKSGVYWAPFPVPFPMAGSNTINVTVTRATGYPEIQDVQIKPVVYGVIVAAVARNSEQTMAPLRREPG